MNGWHFFSQTKFQGKTIRDVYIHFIDSEIKNKEGHPSLIKIKKNKDVYIFIKDNKFHNTNGPAIIEITGYGRFYEKEASIDDLRIRVLASELIIPTLDNFVEWNKESFILSVFSGSFRDFDSYYIDGKKVFSKEIKDKFKKDNLHKNLYTMNREEIKGYFNDISKLFFSEKNKTILFDKI